MLRGMNKPRTRLYLEARTGASTARSTLIPTGRSFLLWRNGLSDAASRLLHLTGGKEKETRWGGANDDANRRGGRCIQTGAPFSLEKAL